MPSWASRRLRSGIAAVRKPWETKRESKPPGARLGVEVTPDAAFLLAAGEQVGECSGHAAVRPPGRVLYLRLGGVGHDVSEESAEGAAGMHPAEVFGRQ